MKLKARLTQFIYATLWSALVMCSSRKPVPDGGPCSYSVEKSPAIIVLIDSMSEDRVNLYLRVNHFGTPDTLDYEHVNNQFLSANDVKGLNIGDSIIYEHHEIVSGACNPDVFRFSLKKE